MNAHEAEQKVAENGHDLGQFIEAEPGLFMAECRRHGCYAVVFKRDGEFTGSSISHRCYDHSAKDSEEWVSLEKLWNYDKKTGEWTRK